MRSHSMVVLVAAILVVMCITTSAQTGHPSKEEVLSLLNEVDGNLARFETLTDQINFTRWNESYGDIAFARGLLDDTRQSVTRTRQKIAILQPTMPVRSDVLFHAYVVIILTAEHSRLFAVSEPNPALKAKLFELSADSTRTETSFARLILQQLAAQEADLEHCQSSHSK